MGLHLRLGSHTARGFICGGSQLALTLGHTTNISWCGLGGDGFSFALCRGKSAPGAGVAPNRAACRARPVLGWHRAHWRCGRGWFQPVQRRVVPGIFLPVCAQSCALLHGEICVLLDDRIGCIGYHRAGILRSCIITVSLCRSAFPQHGSAFLLGLRPRLFQRSFQDFPGCIASRHMRGWLFL